ncbi:MAG: hypothetical protein SVK08_01540 [Halobacteriota archaeon]|nr:hypothetical protein [Halobacteriota archaeon]
MNKIEKIVDILGASNVGDALYRCIQLFSFGEMADNAPASEIIEDGEWARVEAHGPRSRVKVELYLTENPKSDYIPEVTIRSGRVGVSIPSDVLASLMPNIANFVVNGHLERPRSKRDAIEKILVLSTAHMPESRPDFGVLHAIETDESTIVFVSEDEDIPRWIGPAMDKALEYNCTLILFDCDSDIDRDLPIWEW